MNYATPDWAPLERAVRIASEGNVEADPGSILGNMMWMCEEPEGTHQYKHRDTRNYANLRIDSSPEDCRAQIRNALSTERTWGKTMDATLTPRRTCELFGGNCYSPDCIRAQACRHPDRGRS